ncbi:MAG: antibiotic biosynthesis monooxygenase [Chloroflexota bacterium]
MFVAVNRLQMPAEYGAHLEQRFAATGGMDGVPGFVSFELLKSLEGTEYLVVTRWDGRASFDRWRESDAFMKAHSQTNPNSPVRSALGEYDVVLARP